MFLWAYEKSSSHYVTIHKSLGEPDLFYLRHRNALCNVIAEIILTRKNQKEATAYVTHYAQSEILDTDQKRFIEAVKTELLSLHEGNFARYSVTPNQFKAWQDVWKRRALT